MSDFESGLKRLIPNAGTLDRDALLYSAAFAAGKAAGRRPWRRLSGVLATGIVGLSCVGILSNRPPPLPQGAPVPAHAPTVPPAQLEPYQPEPTSYIALMQHMGEYLPTPAEGSDVPPPPSLTPRSRID
jgi:hypothetical protein